jgi:site-specific recombinase XerD
MYVRFGGGLAETYHRKVAKRCWPSLLKEIADLAGINKNLTTHIARHTFATTVTLDNDVPLESVSKMLGHTKLTTTQIYARTKDRKVNRDMAALKNRLKEQKALAEGGLA